jgi:4-amino-4-deoxychorismate lyase
MLAALLNGTPISKPQSALSIEERGLSYGDGVFETMLLHGGAVRLIEDHLNRLRTGCERLRIATPSDQSIRNDIQKLSQNSRDGIVKLIVTRGPGGRRYRASTDLKISRIAMLYPKLEPASREIAVRWCDTRLARNPQLAGIKHLNRLEQVLAQNEWNNPSIAEGLMLDTEGEVVSATASNVFIVSDGVLSTPDLRFCGVRGVMRQFILRLAKNLGIETNECSLRPEDILSASEVFVTNAVRGIRSVTALGEQRWAVGSMTRRLLDAIEAKE